MVMLDTVQPEQQNKTNVLKQQGKGKTSKQKSMLDREYTQQQKQTNDPKIRKGKTHRQKIMLDKVQPEKHNKTNDPKQQGKE